MAQTQDTNIRPPGFGGITELRKDAPPPEMPPRAQIRFGELGHQVISAEVASMMLMLWKERNPAQFGAVLAEAMTGTAPRATRGRS